MSREIKFRAWDSNAKKMYRVYRPTNEQSEYDGLFVMQFTGLLDKNGKDIYEGDILHHNLWGNSKIIWEHGMFRGTGNNHDITLADHQLKKSRVIGNIHENPELLK